MIDTTAQYPERCRWCGSWHDAMCPSIAEIEYFADGRVKRVRFHGGEDSAPQPIGDNTVTPGPVTTWESSSGASYNYVFPVDTTGWSYTNPQ